SPPSRRLRRDRTPTCLEMPDIFLGGGNQRTSHLWRETLYHPLCQCRARMIPRWMHIVPDETYFQTSSLTEMLPSRIRDSRHPDELSPPAFCHPLLSRQIARTCWGRGGSSARYGKRSAGQAFARKPIPHRRLSEQHPRPLVEL